MSTHQHNFIPGEGLSVSCDCGLYFEGDEIIEAVLFWLNGKKLREQNFEMLEALEETMRWLDNDGEYTLDKSKLETKYDCVEMVRAIISKTKGKIHEHT